LLLTVQIVNWNAREPLRAALRSILANPPRFPYEIVVLDNASSDGSVQMLEKEFPEVRLLVSEQNLGFSRGHNLAARADDCSGSGTQTRRLCVEALGIRAQRAVSPRLKSGASAW
jgi:GT2 family glycosyltransferase